MDLTTIYAFLSQWGAIAGLAVGGTAFITSDKWLPLIKGLKFKSGEVPSEDADVIDIGALHLLQARAKRSNCPKFQAAVREIELCWFNQGEAPK